MSEPGTKIRPELKAYLKVITDANELMKIDTLGPLLRNSAPRVETFARMQRICELLVEGLESTDPQKRDDANMLAMKFEAMLHNGL